MPEVTIPAWLIQGLFNGLLAGIAALIGGGLAVRNELKKHRGTRSFDLRLQWHEETAAAVHALANETVRVVAVAVDGKPRVEALDAHLEALEALMLSAANADAYADASIAEDVQDLLNQLSDNMTEVLRMMQTGAAREATYRKQAEALPLLKQLHRTLVRGLKKVLEE